MGVSCKIASTGAKKVTRLLHGISIFTIVVATIVSGCTTAQSKSLFKYEDGIVRTVLHGKNVAITNNNFSMVIDWSLDYRRTNCGVGDLQNGWFIFKGAINHSRDIVFAYKLDDGTVLTFPNAKKAICSSSGLWAVIQMQPLYASTSDNVSVLVKGKEILKIDENQLTDLNWRGSSLILTLSPQ